MRRLSIVPRDAPLRADTWADNTAPQPMPAPARQRVSLFGGVLQWMGLTALVLLLGVIAVVLAVVPAGRTLPAARLAEYHEHLHALERGETPDHPVFQALAPVIRDYGLPYAEFHALLASTHGEGIIAFVQRHGCDLAVLGTRATWNIRDFLWGSTAERVVRECPSSVLTLKPAGFGQGAGTQ